jgi:hypothetical protein
MTDRLATIDGDGRFDDDAHIGPRRRPRRSPSASLEPDVVAHGQAEYVPVEGQRRVVIVHGDEAL